MKKSDLSYQTSVACVQLVYDKRGVHVDYVSALPTVWAAWTVQYTNEPKHCDQTSHLCCWSFACCQNYSDPQRQGLYKTSEGAPRYLAGRIEVNPLSPIRCDMVLPSLRLVPAHLLSYVHDLSLLGPISVGIHCCWLQEPHKTSQQALTQLSGFYSCPPFPHHARRTDCSLTV